VAEDGASDPRASNPDQRTWILAPVTPRAFINQRRRFSPFSTGSRAPAVDHAFARDHRGAGALLPSRRDADDSEQARELGYLSGRDSRQGREGQGDPASSVQPELALGDSPHRRSELGSRGVRVRQREWHLPAEHPDRLGDSNCSHTVSNQRRERTVQHGTRSSFAASTCAGMTCATRAPVACWQTESIFGSFS
jgi:hypothetical protein